MHITIMEWGKTVLSPEVVTGKRVLEVGALDVNGSLQEHVKSLNPAEFVGTDMMDGPGVDVVVDATQLLRTFGLERWDVVMCFEMLEHAEHWQECLFQMKESLAIGGLLVLTTRSPGYPEHDFPSDYWRFTPQVMKDSLFDMGDVVVYEDPGFLIEETGLIMPQPGVFVTAKRLGLVVKPIVKAEPVARKPRGTSIYRKVGAAPQDVIDPKQHPGV